ncbi:MAG: hypothetical protein JNM52_03205 [Betaproteobacteria bacterium]|nr:hypothetical protein [Betaproteobacteria bacterium]
MRALQKLYWRFQGLWAALNLGALWLLFIVWQELWPVKVDNLYGMADIGVIVGFKAFWAYVEYGFLHFYGRTALSTLTALSVAGQVYGLVKPRRI